MELQRLDKLIAGQGMLSRNDVKKLAAKGKIAVNGVLERRTERKVDPERDRIQVAGTLLVFKKHLYLMLNKPKGVVSAARDDRYPTVVDLVPEELRREGLFPAGRLDRDTEGFVLLTEDGDFAHRILSPKSHIPKTYIAVLDRPIDSALQEEFARGFSIGQGQTCMPAALQEAPDYPVQPAAQVVICEGMYHQIKRMFLAHGWKVLELRRTAMGQLPLDEGLAPGECREILPWELELLEKREPLP